MAGAWIRLGGDAMESRSINEVINAIDTIIGDTPVSEQLAAALNGMAPKDHSHEEYVTITEFNKLKSEVKKLIELVGDTSVSEQINVAMNK